MKTCVINFARGGWYSQGQRRLKESLNEANFSGDTLFFDNEQQIGAPSHQTCPYGFKPYALATAIKLGYTHVLWADASVWAIRNIQPMFEHIDKQGWMFFHNTCTGNWTSDACLDVFHISRDKAMKMDMLMGICMGFNMTHPTTQQFFLEWLACAYDGKTFPGSWTNHNHEVSQDPRVYGHRHDQSVASILADKLGMSYLVPHETYFQYYENKKKGIFDGDFSLIKPRVVMVAQGL